MCFENDFQWYVLVSLDLFVSGALAQSLPRSPDMTSYPSAITSVTHWTKCAPITDDNKLRSMPLIPFQLCQKECGLRASCVGVNYWSRGKVCDLLSNLSGLESNVIFGKPCIHVASPVAHNDKSSCPPTYHCGCHCSRDKICESESGFCAVQECPAPHVSNAMLHGNMYAVGSKVKVECASGYHVPLPMVCEETGMWSNYAVCGCPEPCHSLSYATLQPGGANVDGIRKYKCKPGYSTPEGAMQFNVTCLADQKWSTPTTYCGKAMDSDVGPIDYVTIGCNIMKLATFSANHSEAKSACAPFGNLVRIDTAEKQNAIDDYIATNTTAFAHGYWIQGHLDVDDGQWKFDDGSPMPYTKWAVGYPKESKAYGCVRMTNTKVWRNTKCWKPSFRFICELLESTDEP